MAGLGDAFAKGSIGEQLLIWGVLNQLLSALISPAVTELAYLEQETLPFYVLSPAELAQLVNRGFTDEATAAGDAAKNGISGDRFRKLVDLAGEAPGPAALTEALRRGIIAEDGATGGLPSFTDGIRQGNLRDVWAPLYKALAVELPSWQDALDALLEGQLDRATAEHWYKIAGGDPDAFQWLFDTRGTSPTPDMVGTMANRGIIPWDGTGPAATTFQQAFLEGPWRNKWEPAMRRLMEYHPPPRTVVALLREGSITTAEAQTLLQQQGLTPALAAAYVKGAAKHTTTTTKALTKADIEALYNGHVITAVQAHTMLEKLGFDATEAGLITSQVDLRRTISNTNSAISRIRTLEVGRKISAADAAAALHSLGIDAAEASQLIAVWELERAATFRPLTEAQLVAAWGNGVLTQAEAESELVAIGYTAFDAWVLLSNHNKGPLPGKPPRGPGVT
jgi:hypothetical protein